MFTSVEATRVLLHSPHAVGIAFATFTGIVIYHTIQKIKGTRLWKRSCQRHDEVRVPLMDITSGLLRLILFLISAVNALGDHSINLLAIVSVTATILPVILGCGIYKTWSLG